MTTSANNGSLGVTILRIVLGLILVATWYDNVDKSLYSAENFAGFLNWLALAEADGGNGSSLGWYHSLLDTVVISNAGFFGAVQLVVELLIGLGLVFGIFTRMASAIAVGFFASLLLAYFGGGEWIWTYVLLTAASLTVFLNYGGRKFGIDELIVSRKGESPAGMIW
jgi:uncharacterized membrane protein YphA (DoxX/SURF4 family)